MAMPGEQAAVEYGGTAVRNMLAWAGRAPREYWLYGVGAVVLLLLLRWYLRR
jgi:hypothetical protein